MSLLIKEDTFSEEVTKFYMAEAAHAISSVHALGYIHRDIKPGKIVSYLSVLLFQAHKKYFVCKEEIDLI